VECIEERLDTESVASGEHCSIRLIPQHKRKLSSQTVQTLHPTVLVKVQCDLTVRTSTQLVTRLVKIFANGFVSIEFSVNDDPHPSILIGDGLVSRQKVNNAEPRVSKTHPLVL
jgi:hypothetical protein